MTKYRAAIAGCGPRGKIHAHGFRENRGRFDLVAACDVRQDRLDEFASLYPGTRLYADAEAMLAAERPDVFCFCTQPNVRLSLVELGLKYGAKAIAFEKPMATTLAEAKRILDLCDAAGVKTVVSHQQKYGGQFRQAKEIIDCGAIGAIERIHASSKAWLGQLGTHLIDYVMWLNGGSRIRWVVGHIHGQGKLADSHPSPDYLIGQLAFENGVRAYLECGYLSPAQPLIDPSKFWYDNGITVYGEHGFVRATTGGGWQAMTKYTNGETIGGRQIFDPPNEQPLYIRDLADWLDDSSRAHSCHGATAYHGFEAAMGLCLSALERRRIDLPIENPSSESIVERMRRELPPEGTVEYSPRGPIKTW